MDCNCKKEGIAIIDAEKLQKIISILNEDIGRIFSLLEKHFSKSDHEYKNLAQGINKLGDFCSENFKGQLDVLKMMVEDK